MWTAEKDSLLFPYIIYKNRAKSKQLRPKRVWIKSEIFESVIKSDHRTTYKEITALAEGDEAMRGKYPDLIAMCADMKELCGALSCCGVRRLVEVFYTPPGDGGDGGDAALPTPGKSPAAPL